MISQPRRANLGPRSSIDGAHLSSYNKALAVTVEFLAFVGILLGCFSIFSALYGHFILESRTGVILSTISMLVVVAGIARIAGARIFVLSVRWRATVEAWMESCSVEIVDWIDSASPWGTRISIIATAALSLLLELILIRWESGVFAVFALYKNFTLLSCFCGLGIGYAKAKDKQLTLPGSLPVIVLLLLVFGLLRYGLGEAENSLLQVTPIREEASVFTAQDANENVITYFQHTEAVWLLLGLTFILNTLVLLPVGQFCGRLMQRMQPLASYGCNLVGSVAGVILLFALSWAWAGPVIWFSVCAAGIAFFQLASRSARKVALISSIGCVILAAWPVAPLVQTIYSPYQVIEKGSQPNGLMALLISGSYFQKVFDLSKSNANRDADKALQRVVGYYELPFQAARSVSNVAIVGAGTGNDVASALRYNAGHVDAVEIDPAIRDLGSEYHPEHPYQDPRVRSVINDARNFFRASNASYDAIVYGVLDSHIVASHGANMRVDSYVYTREGLQDAFDHLKNGGMMSVSFVLPNRLMGDKVFGMLKSLSGSGPPVAILTGYDRNSTTTFMVSKGADVQMPLSFMKQHKLADVTRGYLETSPKAMDLPTDDWPFFYLEKKMYPATYLLLLVLVMGAAFFLVRNLLPAQRLQLSMAPFFFLGGGFMLIETKAITELGLLFGNTWQVVGITIISVLIMAYVANVFASRLSGRGTTLSFFGLFAILFVGYAVAVHGGGVLASTWPARILMVAILVGPLFFSGLVFSALLAKCEDISGAMAYNLMGAMLGGALEYNSMRFGFSSLYVIAAGLYGLAWLTMLPYAHRVGRQIGLKARAFS